MNKIKNSFYTGIVALLLLACALQWGFTLKGKADLISSYFWLIQGFVSMISLIAHFITAKGLKHTADFHMYYMGSMTVRMLAALFFLLAMVLYMTENQTVFAVNFLITYFAYAGFEIYYLLTNLRPDSEKNGKKDS
jgi:hypothetical protein